MTVGELICILNEYADDTDVVAYAEGSQQPSDVHEIYPLGGQLGEQLPRALVLQLRERDAAVTHTS